MLYAALTKLRGGRGAESGGGVLFMDNPFGALTKNVFMEQVRAVASNHKIQLIFTCGVQDAPSISDYDHFVALRKRPMTGANGDYERVEVVHAGRMEDLRNG
jgi:ABC-type nitrate/sulfonate/bicarbonate transport system ATPase subunit